MAIYLGKNKVSIKYILNTNNTYLSNEEQESNLEQESNVTLPTLIALLDIATEQYDTITSMGTFTVSGTLLTWNTEAEDEGWFINYEGLETKCTVISEEQDSISVTLKTIQNFSQNGEMVQLFFRTRMSGETLYQVLYPNTITTVITTTE